jgi:hypothetical protein
MRVMRVHVRHQRICAGRSLDRRREVALVILVAATLVGCSGSSEAKRGVAIDTQPAETVPIPTVAPSTTVAPSELTACTRTLLPVYADHRVYRMPQPNDEPDPLIPTPPGIERLRYAPPGAPTDREGNPVVQVGATVELGRPDGTVTLSRPGAMVGLVSALADFGDLDGDGHVNHVVAMDDGWYFLREPLAPGVYDPAEVGVHLRLPFPGPGVFAGPVGDQNGDGAEDVAFGEQLYSGRRLVAHRPGTTTTLPPAFAAAPHLAGALRLDPSSAPSLVQNFGGVPLPTASGDALQLRVGKDCLVTEGGAQPGTSMTAMATNSVEGYLVDGHRVIELSQDARNSYVVYRWDLDA